MDATRSISLSSDPRFREIPRERVSDRVATELLKLIADGRLTPGERLPGERQLATMMGVSRVSIRAALQQLKEQGLLSAVQGGGTRLLATARDIDPDVGQALRLDPESLSDLNAIRALLEVWAAGRAAERATPQQVSEIEHLLHGSSASAVGPHDKAQLDLLLLEAIARASGSKVYQHLFSRLRDTLEAALEHERNEVLITAEAEQAVQRQQAAIVAAIGAHDAPAAAAAARAHLDFLRERLRQAASAGPRSSSQAAE